MFLKRFLIVFISLLMMVGCADGTVSAKKLSVPNSFTRYFISQDFEGTLEYNNMGKSTVVFSKPDSVNGLKFSIENGKTIMEYKGMVYDCKKGDNDSATLAESIVETISDFIINSENIDALEENGMILRKAATYTLYQNGDGIPTRIISDRFDINFT